MKKISLVLGALMFGPVAFAQNIQGLYTYESINGVKSQVATQNVETVTSQGYKYDSFSDLIDAEKTSGKSFKKSHAKNTVVVSRSKEGTLIRFNGKFYSMELVDLRGDKVETNYHKEYKGLIIPNSDIERRYFLKTRKKSGETIYKRVTL